MSDLKDVVAVLGAVKLDLQWIIQVGKWMLGATGVALCVLVPLIVTLLVHLANVNARLTVFEMQVAEMVKDHDRLDKKPDVSQK